MNSIGIEALLASVLQKVGPVKFTQKELDDLLHFPLSREIYLEGPDAQGQITIGITNDTE